MSFANIKLLFSSGIEKNIFGFFFGMHCRLREGIRKSPANWQNCSMYLQDLIQQDLNITAEVTQREAENFQVLCQLFVSELRKK